MKTNKNKELKSALHVFISLFEELIENEQRKKKKFGKRFKLFFKAFFGDVSIMDFWDVYRDRKVIYEQAKGLTKADQKDLIQYFEKDFDISKDRLEVGIEKGVKMLLSLTDFITYWFK